MITLSLLGLFCWTYSRTNLKVDQHVNQCMFSFFADHNNDVLNLALVQYHFSQGEHQLKIAPHSNAPSRQSYVRTMPSVVQIEAAEKKTPRRTGSALITEP